MEILCRDPAAEQRHRKNDKSILGHNYSLSVDILELYEKSALRDTESTD